MLFRLHYTGLSLALPLAPELLSSTCCITLCIIVRPAACSTPLSSCLAVMPSDTTAVHNCLDADSRIQQPSP
ncbi:hypothetical protein CGRA01v4_11264 [Colletotrichum graminicola]|nr:hypothetical protein CGRA01v4_11264 [Colletotrichum graminicola]